MTSPKNELLYIDDLNQYLDKSYEVSYSQY